MEGVARKYCWTTSQRRSTLQHVGS
jgi:hypothetical protein